MNIHIPNRNFVHFADAKYLINEADVLLYRGNTWYASFIRFWGGGMYSHVGLASWSNGGKEDKNSVLEILQFLGSGGAATSFEQEIDKNYGLIDVYRPSEEITRMQFDPIRKEVLEQKTKLNTLAITADMRRMGGLPYGYRRIWWIIKKKMFSMFFSLEPTSDDDYLDNIYPVCSTAIAYCFNKNGYDLVKNKSDEWTEPSDIARSAFLNYLFTIKY